MNTEKTSKLEEEKYCGDCCLFFMIGDDPKDGTCGIPPKDGEIRGRNYCYENDIACEDYEKQ